MVSVPRTAQGPHAPKARGLLLTYTEMARQGGFGPPLMGSKPIVLPLHYCLIYGAGGGNRNPIGCLQDNCNTIILHQRLVRVTGYDPACRLGRGGLNSMCIPIPPHSHMVPKEGFAPSHLAALVSKTSVSPVPPLGHIGANKGT